MPSLVQFCRHFYSSAPYMCYRVQLCLPCFSAIDTALLPMLYYRRHSSAMPTYFTRYRAPYTVIRFVWVSAKFGTCTVVSVNGILVEAKICTLPLDSSHFIFISVPFTLTTVQVPNLALTHTKRTTVYLFDSLRTLPSVTGTCKPGSTLSSSCRRPQSGRVRLLPLYRKMALLRPRSRSHCCSLAASEQNH